MRNQPILHSEVKEKHTIALTPTAWQNLKTLAIGAELSISECLEAILRKIDSV